MPKDESNKDKKKRIKVPKKVQKLIDEQIKESEDNKNKTTNSKEKSQPETQAEIKQSKTDLDQANSNNQTTLNQANSDQTDQSETSTEQSDPTTNDVDSNLDINLSFKPGEIVEASIVDEMKRSYIDYAMSVIVARALPDVKDGLKPSQRRILVSMKDLQLWPKAHFSKSGKIVGATLGSYHPHGDQAVYITMVNMAQDFSMRYPLVHGQGNFGTVDGDPPAQQRYTEAKMSKIATELLKDLDKGTVLFTPNYDGTKKEPIVLPAAFPNLLCNGADGIAVGMATKIPPHNLSEVIDALVYLIDQKNRWSGNPIYNELRKLREAREDIPMLLPSEPLSYLENYFHADDANLKLKFKALNQIFAGKPQEEDKLKDVFADIPEIIEIINKDNISLYPRFRADVSTSELMQFIKGPDFPTGGAIYNQKHILQVYETGKGKILMRGIAKIEEDKKGHKQIIITEIPYQVNKAILVQQIAKLVQNKKIKGIKDLRDESNKQGIRIVIELKNSATPKIVVNKLFKYTALQLNFNANMIALVNGEPKTINLKRFLELYLEHRMTVTIRKLEFELASNKYRDHILQGLLKALDFIEEVIKTIRASKTQEEAKTNLMTRFELTTVQAQAILDMPLRRLAALERQKIEDEHKEVLSVITHHEEYLASPQKILALIKEDLIRVKETYGDKRRTKVYKGDIDEPAEEDLIANESTFITLSAKGYIKRVSPNEYRVQRRGGKGSTAASLKEGDYIKHALICSTHDNLLLFANNGRVYSIKAYEIPEFKKNAKGTPIVNLINIDQNTQISAVLPMDKDLMKSTEYILMVTKNGLVKKTKLSEYLNIRKNGLVAITLKEGDKLVQAIPIKGKDEVIIVTKNAKSIRFNESQVKPSGRKTMGVKGISLRPGDKVISMDRISNTDDLLLTISSRGYAKFTKISEFKKQKRGGQGIFAFKLSDKRGHLISAKVVSKNIRADDENNDIMIISKNGVVIKTKLSAIPILHRQTGGVIIMKLSKEDEVSGVSV